MPQMARNFDVDHGSNMSGHECYVFMRSLLHVRVVIMFWLIGLSVGLVSFNTVRGAWHV